MYAPIENKPFPDTPIKAKSDGASACYYILPPNALQLQDLISHRNMNAQIGEIFRECYRYGIASHSDELRGIKKILFYAQAELERLEKRDKKNTSTMKVNCPNDDVAGFMIGLEREKNVTTTL
jgi:hypothetical protein